MALTRNQKIAIGALTVGFAYVGYRRYAHSYQYGPLTGSIHGGVQLHRPGPLADGESAMSFDGQSGWIEIAQPVFNGSAWSWEGWMAPTAYQGSPLAWSTQPGLTTAAQNATYLANFPPYGFLFGANTNYSLSGGLVTAPVKLNQWAYWVVTYTAQSGLILTINGKPTQGPPTHANATGQLYPTIGAGNLTGWYDNVGNFFQGSLAHIATYDYALSASQIRAHWVASQNKAWGTYSRLVLADKPQGYWPLNETSGTVAHDVISLH